MSWATITAKKPVHEQGTAYLPQDVKDRMTRIAEKAEQIAYEDAYRKAAHEHAHGVRSRLPRRDHEVEAVTAV